MPNHNETLANPTYPLANGRTRGATVFDHYHNDLAANDLLAHVCDMLSMLQAMVEKNEEIVLADDQARGLGIILGHCTEMLCLAADKNSR